MNLKKIFFLVILLFLILPVKTYSNEIIAYLDIDYIFKNSNLGKIIITKLNEENKSNLIEIKKKEDLLIKDEKDLIEKKNLLSKAEFENKLSELRSNIKLFKQDKDKLVKAFEKKKNDEIKVFFNKVNPILENYMSENSIKIIIDKKNVLIAKDTLDITMSINQLINQNFNE